MILLQTPPVQKKHRWRLGTCALQEIRKYQKRSEPIIPKAPFARLVKEIMFEYSGSVNRVQLAALGAPQQGEEDILVSLF